jgi:hypothetical protein
MGLRAWVVSGLLLAGTVIPAAASTTVTRVLYKAPDQDLPAWLEPLVLKLAELDTQRFQLEVYQGDGQGDGSWLVRVLELPEGDEAYRTLEQVYFFTHAESGKPLAAKEVTFEPQGAKWKKKLFRLVQRDERALKP